MILRATAMLAAAVFAGAGCGGDGDVEGSSGSGSGGEQATAVTTSSLGKAQFVRRGNAACSEENRNCSAGWPFTGRGSAPKGTRPAKGTPKK